MEMNKTSEDSIKILNRRSFIIIIFGAILSLLVALRLFALQVINFNFYKKKSVENKVSVKATPPIRGDIFDSEKNLVAANASLYEFVIYKDLNKNYLDEVNKLDKLINKFLSRVYFRRKPPKSDSTENYNFSEIYSREIQLSKFDWISAMTEITAKSIFNSLKTVIEARTLCMFKSLISKFFDLRKSFIKTINFS